MGGAAAADAGSRVSSDVMPFHAQPNLVTRQHNSRDVDGSSLDNSSDHGDIVTTTHTISEMRVHERSKRGRRSEKRGRRSEKRVVVKMAVSHRHDGDSDEDDERDGHDTNGNGHHGARIGGQGISVEEIDDDDDENEARPNARPTSSELVVNGSNGNDHLQVRGIASDATVQDRMAHLTAGAERMKQYFYDQDQVFQRESEYLAQLQQEKKALKAMAKEYKCRAREQKRVQRILREMKRKDERHRHSSKSNRTHKVKKQCQRLQQFQSELALRLEVVQSKNSVYEMHVERQLGDLRREYSDNYLFPNAFPFQ